ncbi:MAG TPA: LPS assembly lipoprotein LptE [bacterium]|nr:LPS assembly lipoprotein LptE [bacterium]
MKINIVLYSFVISVLFVFSGCSHSNVKVSNDTLKPKNPAGIFVPVFKNNSLKPAANEYITESFIDITAASKLFVITDKNNAEYEISGEVVSYSVSKQALDYYDSPQMKRLDVAVSYILKRKTKNNSFQEILNKTESGFAVFSETGISNESEKETAEKLYRILTLKIFDKLKRTVYAAD